MGRTITLPPYRDIKDNLSAEQWADIVLHMWRSGYSLVILADRGSPWMNPAENGRDQIPTTIWLNPGCPPELVSLRGQLVTKMLLAGRSLVIELADGHIM